MEPHKEDLQDLAGMYIVSFFFSFLSSFLITILYFEFFIILIYLFRGSQPAVITSTTLEVVVPSSLVPVIYGEDGECLKQIRKVQSMI